MVTVPVWPSVTSTVVSYSPKNRFSTRTVYIPGFNVTFPVESLPSSRPSTKTFPPGKAMNDTTAGFGGGDGVGAGGGV
jgi:hypothetical protein